MDELQQTCEQIAYDHITKYRAWEHRELTRRLADAVPDSLSPEQQAPDLIRQQVADLVRAAGQYLEQDQFSDTTKAEQVAKALLALRDAMLDSQECEEMDHAGDEVRMQIEQLAREHGPRIRRRLDQERVHDLLLRSERLHQSLMALGMPLARFCFLNFARDCDATKHLDELFQEMHGTVAAALCDVMDALAADQVQRTAEQTAEQLADRVLAEVREETPAHISPARLRLYRLASYVQAWRVHGNGPHDDAINGVMVELLLLCEHLGITGQQLLEQQTGGAL